jgi:hypothetical protein
MKKLVLPDITLLAATSVGIDSTARALAISSREIQFGAIKLLSSSAPSVMSPDIEFVQIPHMNFLGYSRFILKDLYRYFETPYCLVVQADGFVVNTDYWRDEFLQYDYIGAPWPEGVWKDDKFLPLNKNRVGNGGFSLRSRKLMQQTANIDFDSLDFLTRSEDIVICHYLYEKMLEKGTRFAPPELAAIFSMESLDGLYGQNIDSVFGFHGKYLLSEVLRKIVKNSPPVDQILSRDIPAYGFSNIGRNESCPCGSGKKYKHCHGRLN